MLLVSNLIAVMSDKEAPYLSGQQQKLCMKMAHSLLNQFKHTADIATIIGRLIKEDPNVKSNDMVFSMLISSFIKPLLHNRVDPANSKDALLLLVTEVVIPKTMDVMADDAPHVLNITQ